MKQIQTVLLATATLLAGNTFTGDALALAQAAATQSTPESGDLIMDLTPAEATKQAGFSVKVPKYLPEGNYYPTLSYKRSASQVVISYHGNAGNPFFLRIHPGEAAKERGELKEVSFAKGKAYMGKQPDKYDKMNVFIWEEEKGLVYELASGLSADELKKIAESVDVWDPAVIEWPEVKGQAETTQELTREEAEQKFGSSFKVPTLLPLGATLSYGYTKGKESSSVDIFNETPGNAAAFLSIVISKESLEERKKSVMQPKTIKPVKIGTSEGISFHTPGSSYRNPDLTHFNGLLWEDKGITYMMTSDMTVEQMITVAEWFR
ncbi:DUF4367 domain-containing protein [Brevibacillus ruminantium]|uniref:DUF4367 domain-containing protein n=1 Tax=Brevibacillus ruminantium TaxID=2950604 RepID=A0ABY4WJG6_9BACL|nr:DUF4367 domain-containing protein [Brevibacillus ruminantium]USG67173.1 DUF4367 domain-containing protein [Brevibacillus ruminantium]